MRIGCGAPSRARRTAAPRHRNANAVTQEYVKTARILSRHAALPFAETMTPGEFQREIETRLGTGVTSALHPLTRTVEKASYGPELVETSDITEARSAQQAVKRSLRGVPRYRVPKPVPRKDPDAAVPSQQ